MRRPLAFGLAIAVLPIVFLAACASPGRGYRESEIVVIRLALDPPGACRASLGGRDFALPANEAAFLAALRSRAKASPDAIVTAGETTPYDCFGHTVFLAERAGFRRVGFIAEPPPPPGR
ncbi:MAG TPA: hypothetical protein VE053_05290 [Allosphingosinicella sp.]|nr:hypothetical protein [Allosphingosinicella sp.]